MGYLDFQVKILLLSTLTKFHFYEILRNTVCFRVGTVVFFSSDILYSALLMCTSNSTSSPVQKSVGSFKCMVVLLSKISFVMFHILCFLIYLFKV